MLINLITEFKREKDKFLSFSQLLAKYSIRGDVTVNMISEQKTEKPKAETKQTPNVSENKIQVETNDKKINNEGFENFKDIKKYNERNLDL